jgi:type IV secretory pathway TrbD component
MKALSTSNVAKIVILIGTAVCIVAFAMENSVMLGIGLAVFIVGLVVFTIVEP